MLCPPQLRPQLHTTTMSRLLFIATAALVATSACAKNIAVSWKIPTTPNTITAAKGDTITFTWGGNHNVYQSATTDPCDFTTAGFADLGAVSPVTFTMGDKAVYFGCQIPGHCGAGQKLTVTPEATPAPTWEGTATAYKYTDALCTTKSVGSATAVSTTTKSVRSSATTACISVTAGSTNQFFRQTCAAGATTYTQQSCDGADCGVCDGTLMTYTIEKSLRNAGSGNYMGYCVSNGGNHYMGNVGTTTAGDHNLATAPCFQASTMSPTPSPMMSPTPSPTAGGTIQTTAATTITSSPIAFAAAVVVAAAMAR